MVTATDIGAAVGSIKAALDITKALITLRDADAFRIKSVELNGLILDAYEKAIAARTEQSALVEEKQALEAEITKLKEWGADKQRYELKNIGNGVMARALKADADPPEAPHTICPDCYENGVKHLLQPVRRSPGMSQVQVCQHCNWEGYVSGMWHPEHGGRSASRKR